MWVFKKKIKPYDKTFWKYVEILWLIISFAGVSLALYELDKLKKQVSYQEDESQILSDYNDIRNSIFGEIMIMSIDNNTPNIERESVTWFYKLESYFNEGYKSDKWKSFLYYTRAFVFNERGFININQNGQMVFEWPKDLSLDPQNLKYRDRMRYLVNKLIVFEGKIFEFEKIKPDSKPNFIFRYLFTIFFTLGLSLKLLKIYAESRS